MTRCEKPDGFASPAPKTLSSKKLYVGDFDASMGFCADNLSLKKRTAFQNTSI
ncbi:hypothetical protein [Microcoleus sp.]|uniref:hypothetical protein n=1 Tax=Microcoleus sp. TaxID=44472 RepID=UPI00030F6E5B